MTTEQVVTHAAETAISTAASKTTYMGAGMTIGGWLLSSQFAVLVGIVLGIAGFLVNWYYKHKQDRREQVEHKRKLAYYDNKKDE